MEYLIFIGGVIGLLTVYHYLDGEVDNSVADIIYIFLTILLIAFIYFGGELIRWVF